MSRSWWAYRRQTDSRRWRFHVVSPPGPKKSARMLLSTPWTANPSPSKNSTASEPIRPALPVTRTFIGPGRCRGRGRTWAQSLVTGLSDSEAVRVAVTLEQVWHQVPGGSARAVLDAVRAVAARGDVEQIGVSAWHRQPPPAAWAPSIPVRQLPLPRIPLYDAWQRLRRPHVERATGPVDVVHATAHVASASRAPWVATVHDLHFLHEPG